MSIAFTLVIVMQCKLQWYISPHALSHLQELEWFYCPDHAGVHGTERATGWHPGTSSCEIVRLSMEDVILVINDHLLHKEAHVINNMQMWLMESVILFRISGKRHGRGQSRSMYPCSLTISERNAAHVDMS